MTMASMTSVKLKLSGAVDGETGNALTHAINFLGRLTDSTGVSEGPDRRLADIWGLAV